MIHQGIFTPSQNKVDENAWLHIVEQCHGGAEGGPSYELQIMDTYMAGLVRWMNEIGIQTSSSCDGHGNMPPRLWIHPNESFIAAKFILDMAGLHFRKRGNEIQFFSPRNLQCETNRDNYLTIRQQLLGIAEWIFTKKVNLKNIVNETNKVSCFPQEDRSKRCATNRFTENNYETSNL